MLVTKNHPELVPEWAFKAMLLDCPFCGGAIVQNENLTARRCINPKCTGHMAYKLEDLAKHFGAKGIGPATAVSIIKQRNFQSHFDIIPIWYPGKKPLVHLSDIAALAEIDGYGKTQAERDLASYSSFEEYFSNASYVHPLLLNNKEILLSAEKYFTVLPPLSDSYINVMGTGSFHDYSSREAYFNMVNFIFGEYIHVIECGKRKTGVAFLIKEADAVDHSKSAIAAEYGIPVITPMDFIRILCAKFHISIEDIRRKGEQYLQ